jgi:hypothetical protein
MNAMVPQGLEHLRTFRQLLETTISRRIKLRFVAAGMRRRIDAIVPHGELVVRTVRQLLLNLKPRNTLAFVVAGVVGLALVVLILLEISVRMELAKEASDAAIDATPAPSPSAPKMEFVEAFPTQATGSILLQSGDQLGVPGATPSSDYVQTFGQAFREPVPLPRPRKSR